MSTRRRSQWTLTLALAVCSSASSAALINFVDLTDGLPLVTTDLPFAQITNSFEKTDVDALVAVGPTGGLPVPVGSRAVGLREPPGDFNQPISDLLTLTAEERLVQNAAGVFQPVHLSFVSDTFGSVSLPDPAKVPFVLIPELGTLQDVTFELNAGGLQVAMQSDVGGPEVPEPSTVLLFGIGLAGLAAFRLRRV